MRALLRRVNSSQVLVDNVTVGKIGEGMVAYIGFGQNDENSDLIWMAQKILGIRIFEDTRGNMNMNLNPDQGILVISQFTLFGNLKKGFRPSFHRAAPPDLAESLYHEFLDLLKLNFDGQIEKGVFGASMQIHSLENGPVNIWLDSKNKNF